MSCLQTSVTAICGTASCFIDVGLPSHSLNLAL